MTLNRWTKEEDAVILNALDLKINLTVVKLKGRTYSAKRQRAQTLRQNPAQKSPVKNEKKAVKKSSKTTSRSPWTKAEDQTLGAGRRIGLEYSEIKLEGRSTGAKRTHWNAVQQGNKVRKAGPKSWTNAEDTKLLNYKELDTEYKDMDISGRTPNAIKFHWLNSLKKGKSTKGGPRKTSRRTWTQEEEKILYLARVEKVKYKDIKIRNRSTYSIRNHWNLHANRIKREYFPNVKVEEINVEEIKVEEVNVDEIKVVALPKIHVELRKLCKGHTAYTIPESLGDYCLLLDEAVRAGWLPLVIHPNTSSLRAPEAHSRTDAKTLYIKKDGELVLQTRSKIKIWKTKVVSSQPEDTMVRKVQDLEGLMASQVFDLRGNYSPISTKG